MAVSIAFNFTTAQENRIQAARAIYNTQNGTTLTPKQYLLTVIKEDVKQRLASDVMQTAANTANSAAATELAAIDTDLVGNA